MIISAHFTHCISTPDIKEQFKYTYGDVCVHDFIVYCGLVDDENDHLLRWCFILQQIHYDASLELQPHFLWKAAFESFRYLE